MRCVIPVAMWQGPETGQWGRAGGGSSCRPPCSFRLDGASPEEVRASLTPLGGPGSLPTVGRRRGEHPLRPFNCHGWRRTAAWPHTISPNARVSMPSPTHRGPVKWSGRRSSAAGLTTRCPRRNSRYISGGVELQQTPVPILGSRCSLSPWGDWPATIVLMAVPFKG